MKVAIIVFPGTWSDGDCMYAMHQVGADPYKVWHTQEKIGNPDMVIIPGGFSYGDYLRCGAIAQFSNVMKDVVNFAISGGIVVGICNGFQILCESELLPGVLIKNDSLQFRCEDTFLKINDSAISSPFLNNISINKPLKIPISHGSGNYFVDDLTLKKLKKTNRIAFQYSNSEGIVEDGYNPNGSVDNIAGILNESGNVLGMMPHPERASDVLLSGTDGNLIWNSVMKSMMVKNK
ncbi:MAG: phosphoribosylformylglycinamidine synthase [Chloroflexi bacterium]|jgi:phosphoribosylformylglycinamidine synthase I|nr:MAG: phosphoribosylformylglycinamidine synthase [Chloroflexota bacterium]|tara:strand:- start:8678 stop:9382 length:705 start_codon:yes stop_codon:yes gene_type:complete